MMYRRIIAILLVMLALLANVSLAADISSTAGRVVTESTALNIRSGPGTGNAVIGKLDKGSYVTLYNESNGWWKVEYGDGKTGFVSSAYIEEAKESRAYYVNTESTKLNVRSGPGTSYLIESKLDKNKYVVVLSESNGWSKILYDGIKTGYVSSTYLANKAAEPEVSLKITRYAQTDSRWANLKIGTSGKTISDIGCLTTAIAMLETYRTGSVITPDVIAKTSRYTATGALYWPANFITSTSTNYMQVIHSLLKEGKPVLIGGKTTGGGQHWVVVTGYTGGDINNKANYIISDPGKANRTTLAQFFAEYPVYYKIAYYI